MIFLLVSLFIILKCDILLKNLIFLFFKDKYHIYNNSYICSIILQDFLFFFFIIYRKAYETFLIKKSEFSYT